ncbi:hypothetical protein M2323_001426 [Rhodoblastus acidophilus]|uniref:hypothetical protein n=1 Tax=Rhodoblastus acidophilus TaxID=1074 RepID=UPI0022245AA4|nr:hypothetical protein [Rhodoblastus acidophilus]MCW2283654.1 hypothetical protein [Rhodoblastus acidophilus]MCW2332514.1 hypothetical protein [Rhodoblastus acidophilus]
MEPHQSDGWTIEASAHDERGFVTCVAAGAIVWRGPLAKLAAADMPRFEVIYCHDDDVGQIVSALGKEPTRKRARQISN